MTPDRFRLLIEGVLSVWTVEADIAFKPTECRCAITSAGQVVAAISFERQPFGAVWRVEETGRRDRVHPSVGGALKSLREILRPDRPSGRVLFVSEGG